MTVPVEALRARHAELEAVVAAMEEGAVRRRLTARLSLAGGWLRPEEPDVNALLAARAELDRVAVIVAERVGGGAQ